jgi:beta-RFAP synthase
MSVRVVAPCRLHFGLMHVPTEGMEHLPRFGGVGLMVESPSLTVTVERSAGWSASGSLGIRGLEFLKLIWEKCPENHYRGGAFHVLAEGPSEHVGLGVGTALGMAVAHAYFREIARPVPEPIELARLAGRGLRSGIGVHGSWAGGLIVDPGKSHEQDVTQHVERAEWPAEWRVVLLQPPVVPGWYGDREKAAFARTRTPTETESTANRLSELAYGELLPAARAKDFERVSTALYSYNRLAGEPFAVDQGGAYAGPEVAGIIDTVRSWGIRGVGQSSWGPTVFALVEDESRANELVGRARDGLPVGTESTVSRVHTRGQIVAAAEIKMIR